jgi:cytochrome c-type biogenesis protein CcmH/NrfG
LVSEGRVLLKDGKLIAAQGRFQAAVEAHPKNLGALIGLATVAFERARYFKSVELARRSVALGPRSVQGHLLLGDAYFKLHQYGKALAAWNRALDLDPGNRRLAKRIEHVQQKIGAP